jgi:ankyrin repeat protein
LGQEERGALDDAIMAAFLDDSDAAFDALLTAARVHSMADFDEEAASMRVNHQHSSAGATPLMAAAGKGRVHEVLPLTH